MPSLPEEICFEILLKVPAKSLLACKCVCKTWYSLISDPGFIKMNLNLTVQRNKPTLMLKGWDDHREPGSSAVLYSVNHDSLKSLLTTDKFLDYAVELDYPFKSLGYEIVPMGSRDGLVCLWCRHRDFFCLWNPATREYKVLPISNMRIVSMVAFGFDYKKNDYKILAGCIYDNRVFEVCWLGSNAWKRIKNVPYDFYDYWKESGTLVNGDHHWFAKRKDSSHVVVSLDLINEIFSEIELPQEVSKNDKLFNLGVSEGCLCFLKYIGGDVGHHFDIWVMQNYGVRESWTKRYTVNNDRINPYGTFLRHVWSFKGGEILFQGGDRLVSYDSVCSSVREPNISNLIKLYYDELYFESLVSLNSGTHIGEEEPMEDFSEYQKKKSQYIAETNKKRRGGIKIGMKKNK